jgi:hypothetical protein
VPDQTSPTAQQSRAAADTSTFDNLVAENALLRAQLDLLLPESVQGNGVASALAGARGGDQIICRRETYRQTLAAVLLPVSTAVELYAADHSAPELLSRTRVLVEPDRAASSALTHREPDALVLNVTMTEFFHHQPDHSIDSVVLRPTAFVDAHYPCDRAFWMGEARRIARRQVILFSEFTPERSAAFPWRPEDFSGDLVIVNEDAEGGRLGRQFCVVRNVQDSSAAGATARAVLVSEWDPSFNFRKDDFLVCDHEIARDRRLIGLAVAGIVVVPLKLLRESLSLPTQVLHRAVLNYSVLERYVEHMPAVAAIGFDAEFVLDHMRHLLRGARRTG